MIPPKQIQNLLTDLPWLNYIPMFKTARLSKVAELYEAAGDNASIPQSINYNLELAADYYVASSEYYENVESLYRAAIMRMKAAQVYHTLKYLDNSNMQYLVASDIFKDIANTDCYVLCVSKIAENFWAMGEYECAVKHYETCIKHNMLIGKDHANVKYLDCIGTIWSIHMGKYNLAITVYEKLVKMTEKHVYMFILGLLCIMVGKGMGVYDRQFIDSYYGEYLILLTNHPYKAVEMYDVYKDFIGQCELLDILHKKISESVV